jgi:hypothetical protein
MRNAAARPRSVSAELLDGCIDDEPGIERPTLRATQLQEQRDQTLLRTVVQVALEASPRVVCGGDDARPRAAHLFFVALALGDVRARDQVHRAARDPRERGARPRHLDRCPIALHPPALALAVRPGMDGGEDAVAGIGALAVGHVPIPEILTSGLVRFVAKRPLEGLVRGERADAAVPVDQAQQARRVVRDRVQELALELELGHPSLERRRRFR